MRMKKRVAVSTSHTLVQVVRGVNSMLICILQLENLGGLELVRRPLHARPDQWGRGGNPTIQRRDGPVCLGIGYAELSLIGLTGPKAG